MQISGKKKIDISTIIIIIIFHILIIICIFFFLQRKQRTVYSGISVYCRPIRFTKQIIQKGENEKIKSAQSITLIFKLYINSEIKYM